ncbi:aspartate aminotransferase family protein [Parapusillimonas sp. SGNA-6]|nr:aspartate aminotransferase family protein [Parapusillimonas sp. SGNA-6]
MSQGPLTHAFLQDDDRRLDDILLWTCRYASALLADLDDRSVVGQPSRPAQTLLPENGSGFAAALADFQSRWAPGFSASAGPRYLGFVTGGATPASLAGDWLTSTFDQNPTSALDSSAPHLERETVGWLRALLGLPAEFEGAFVTGATMSNFVGLAIAREWVGEQRGLQVSGVGLAALGPVKVFSGAPHSSIYKALSMLGMGRQAVTRIPVMAGREAVDVSALEAALKEGEGEAAIVVANAGTVNTVDFDDIAAIAELKTRYRFWLHVDGAFGAFAALSPDYAHWVAGMELADSVCVDCHKWLNVPYDSAVQFSRRPDLQVRVFQNSAAYLGLPGDEPDFVHLTPENSRRLRALAAWFALSAYGRAGHRDIVERNVDAARALGRLIEGEPALTLLAPVRMNVACFALSDDASEAATQAFLKRVSDSGDVFLTPTVLNGTWAIRAAFSNWRTQREDVSKVFKAIQAALAPRAPR